MRPMHWLWLSIATGCVSTPLRAPEDGGPRVLVDLGPALDEWSGPDTDSGIPCSIQRGACLSSDPAVACCWVRGWRSYPDRRCTEPAGRTHDTYECQQFPSTEQSCGRPVEALPEYDCYVRRVDGRVVEVISLQRTLTPLELTGRGWEVCDEATVADIRTYPRCPL